MTDYHAIRILQDPALDGPTNMARDEALLTRVGAGESPPTFRLYQWTPPTISLGYFQRYADYKALPPPAGTLPVVRRLTGGGAILHDLELTYSLTLPLDHPLMSRGPNSLYEMTHDAIIASLEHLRASAHRGGATDDSGPARGPFFCFSRRHRFDVLIGEAKVAGSAQRRAPRAILQHGSMMLGSRFNQQSSAIIDFERREAVVTLRATLPERMAQVTAEAFEPGDWSQSELALATMRIAKYAGDPWTKRL